MLALEHTLLFVSKLLIEVLFEERVKSLELRLTLEEPWDDCVCMLCALDELVVTGLYTESPLREPTYKGIKSI